MLAVGWEIGRIWNTCLELEIILSSSVEIRLTDNSHGILSTRLSINGFFTLSHGNLINPAGDGHGGKTTSSMLKASLSNEKVIANPGIVSPVVLMISIDFKNENGVIPESFPALQRPSAWKSMYENSASTSTFKSSILGSSPSFAGSTSGSSSILITFSSITVTSQLR